MILMLVKAERRLGKYSILLLIYIENFGVYDLHVDDTADNLQSLMSS